MRIVVQYKAFVNEKPIVAQAAVVEREFLPWLQRACRLQSQQPVSERQACGWREGVVCRSR